MTTQVGGVSQLQDSAVLGTTNRNQDPFQSPLDRTLDSLGNSSNHAGGRQDFGGSPGVVLWLKLAGECIRLDIAGTRTIRQRKVKAVEKQCPPGLLWVQPLGGSDVLKVLVLMVSPCQE